MRILDGGLAAWRSAGGSLATDPVTPPPGDATVLHDDLYNGALPTLTAQQVNDFTLLDARAPERFRGDVEPIDPCRRTHPRREKPAQRHCAHR